MLQSISVVASSQHAARVLEYSVCEKCTSKMSAKQSQSTAASIAAGGTGEDAVGMDSVLNFPLYWSLVTAFGITGQRANGSLDLTILKDKITEIRSGFADPTVLGTFLENQDVPRWSGLSVDPQSL